MAAIGNLAQYGNTLSQMATMLPEINAPKNFEAKLKAAINSSEKAELKEACEEMESYILGMVYKQMRQSLDINSETAFLPKGDYETMFEDFMVDNQVQNMVDSGGVGLSGFLYKQISEPQLPMQYQNFNNPQVQQEPKLNRTV